MQIFLAIAAVFGVVLYRMSMLTTLSLLEDNSLATRYSVIIIPATAATINLVCIMIFNYVSEIFDFVNEQNVVFSHKNGGLNLKHQK